jgi:NTP pyrophosphatase (non-canonical NTP hydrolase)
MHLNEYQELCKRTMPEPYSLSGKALYTKDSKVNYIMGLAGETGELIDLLKKEWFHGHTVSETEKKKELGDIFHYLFGLCEMLGFTSEEVATLNVMKLAERYPNGFSMEDSIRRVDVSE